MISKVISSSESHTPALGFRVPMYKTNLRFACSRCTPEGRFSSRPRIQDNTRYAADLDSLAGNEPRPPPEGVSGSRSPASPTLSHLCWSLDHARARLCLRLDNSGEVWPEGVSLIGRAWPTVCEEHGGPREEASLRPGRWREVGLPGPDRIGGMRTSSVGARGGVGRRFPLCFSLSQNRKPRGVSCSWPCAPLPE